MYVMTGRFSRMVLVPGCAARARRAKDTTVVALSMSKLALLLSALPLLPVLVVALAVAVVATASLLPGERLRTHVRELLPLMAAVIAALRGGRPTASRRRGAKPP